MLVLRDGEDLLFCQAAKGHAVLKGDHGGPALRRFVPELAMQACKQSSTELLNFDLDVGSREAHGEAGRPAWDRQVRHRLLVLSGGR
jgi:hypothetical protein